MKYVLAAAWALFVAVEIFNGFGSGGTGPGMAYGLAAFLGGVGVIVYLRLWRSRRLREVTAEIASGDALWAAQVRELLPGGRGGLSGRLLLRPDSSLDLHPDASSLKRGAVAQSWGAGEARIESTRWRRDITGIRFQVLEVYLPNDTLRRFGAFALAGSLPEESPVAG